MYSSHRRIVQALKGNLADSKTKYIADTGNRNQAIHV
jgi:hypothetical protein